MNQRPQKFGKRLWKVKHLYLYLIPTFFLLFIFNYYPPLSAFYHSFFDWNGIADPHFIGVQNFVEMARDPLLLSSLRNLLILVVGGVVTSLTMPLLVAELIFNLSDLRLAYAYRLLFVVPIVVPVAVAILLWQFLLDPNFGPINAALGSIGLIDQPIDWLGNPKIALYALLLVGFPWVNGVNVLIYLAGLQNIPTSVYDNLKLEGANIWTRLRYIDIPLLTGQIKLIVVLGIIAGVQGFNLQFLLTGGGPGFATTVPSFLIYRYAFSGSRFGYASAIGLALFVVILGLTYLNLRFLQSSTEHEGT